MLDISWISNYNRAMKNDKTISLIATARAGANNYLKRELKKHGLQGLVPTHGNIIFALLSNEQMTMKDLATVIRRDKSTVTTLVAKLENLGYVERLTCPDDNRISFVRLTVKGRELREPFEAISDGLIETGLRGLSSLEKEQLSKTLLKIIENFF